MDSPRDVPTYDKKPEMSAREAARAFTERWREGDFTFGIINFANPDMVGHTGVIEAAVEAVETVDECLGEVVRAVEESGGVCVITADHGNADQMLEPDGSPNTAHSMNPVPLIVTADVGELREDGTLADVAPTILALLGEEQPPQMTGKPLQHCKGSDPLHWLGTVPAFEITARDGAARAGVIQTAHGPVRTPAFVPLASTATVKSLHASEVAELGYDMVLGNTFHLFIQPGHELIAEMGGLHEFMGWERPIITDSGGYQVFSMGHGSVAEEIKRSRDQRKSMVISIAEEGVRFRSYADGRERFMGPETSMEVQAALRLGHRARLRRVHALPRRARLHGSVDGAHPPLARPLRRLVRRARAAGQLLYGIVQGGVYEDLRAESAAYVAGAGVDGIAIGGSLGQEKEQMREVVGWALAGLPAEPPRHLLGIGDVDDIVHAVGRGDRHLRLRNAHAARTPRHGARERAGRPLAARPHQGRAPHERRADRPGLPVPGLPRAHSRLPALPDPDRRADRQAAAHAPQPHLHGAPDAAPARRDRRGRLRGRGGARCSAGVRLDEVAQPVDLLLNVGLLDRVHAAVARRRQQRDRHDRDRRDARPGARGTCPSGGAWPRAARASRSSRRARAVLHGVRRDGLLHARGRSRPRSCAAAPASRRSGRSPRSCRSRSSPSRCVASVASPRTPASIASAISSARGVARIGVALERHAHRLVQLRRHLRAVVGDRVAPGPAAA